MGNFSLINELFLLGFVGLNVFFVWLVLEFWEAWGDTKQRNFCSRKYYKTIHVPYKVVAFRGIFQSLCWEIGKLSKASW